jgi:hypothetical protein
MCFEHALMRRLKVPPESEVGQRIVERASEASGKHRYWLRLRQAVVE